MSVRRRLDRLEGRFEASDEYLRPVVSRKVYERMTTEELKAYYYALRRKRDGEEPTEEDWPILARVQELRGQVMNEHQATPR